MKKLIFFLALFASYFEGTAQTKTKTFWVGPNSIDTPMIRFPNIYTYPGRDRLLKTSDKGINNGVASLDAGGKVPITQMPSSLFIYKGTWNPSTNTPTLSDGTGTSGNIYLCSVGGSRNLGSGSVTYAAGDYVVHNGSIWQKSAGTAYVNSVNGQQGIVTLNTSHISEVTNLYYTPQRAIDAMTGNDISMRKLTITGTAGNGFVGLAAQSSAPSAPASGVNIYAPNAGGFGWVNSSGYTRTFSNPSAASNLTFTLPQSSGNLKTTNVANDSFTVAQTFPQGTVTATSINFGTPSTGLWGNASNVNISNGGAQTAAFYNGGQVLYQGALQLPSVGTATNTSLHFGTAGTGIYGTGTQMNFAVNGNLALQFNNNINAIFQGSVFSSSDIRATGSGNIYFNTRAGISSPSDGNLLLRNSGQTDFGLLQFGGTTSSFPALKRSGSTIMVRTADDALAANIDCNSVVSNSIYNRTNANNSLLTFSDNGLIASRNIADGQTILTVTRSNASATGLIQQWNNSSGIIAGLSGNGVMASISLIAGNSDVSLIQPSAVLQANSSNRGFLPPRLTGVQTEAISSPAAGLMVYCNNGNGSTVNATGWWGYNGSAWVLIK